MSDIYFGDLPAGDDNLGHSFYIIDHTLRFSRNGYYREMVGEESKKRKVYVVIPNYMEARSDVERTVKNVALANKYAYDAGIDFQVDGIVLSDQCKKDIRQQRTMINRGDLFTDKDWIKRVIGEDKIRPPSIYHFVLDEEVDEILDFYSGDQYGHILSEEEPRGKGWNMMLSSLATGNHVDDEILLIYMDADNLQIGPDQVIAMGLPAYYINPRAKMDEYSGVKFVKSFFRRFHMEEGKKKIGGRVNSSVFKPYVNLLHEKGLLPKLGYPLTGEISITRDTLFGNPVGKRYGIEWGMIVNLLARKTRFTNFSRNLDLRKEFAEVFIGENHDKPIADGESKQVVLRKTGNMVKQIMDVNNMLLGPYIRSEWHGGTSHFMADFDAYQDNHFERLDKLGLEIAGGVDPEVLKLYTRGIVEQKISELFGESIPYRRNPQFPQEQRVLFEEIGSDDELLSPLYSVREKGYSHFDSMIADMTSKRETIFGISGDD